MVLTITNSVTKQSYTCEVEDMGTSRDYYVFQGFILPEGIPDGDYNYTLLDEGDTEASRGIIRIGDYKPDNKTYQGGRMTYKYYKNK